jgi:hypothetical protein
MLNKVICMFYDDNIKIYSELTEQINRCYAFQNNCDFFVKKNNPYFTNRHQAWERIPMIIDLLKKDYDYVIYIDADAYFRLNNDSTLLNRIIRNHKDMDIIFSRDLSQLINTGFMIVKNTRFSRNFLWKLVINPKFKDKYYERTWDQDCIIEQYRKNYLNALDKCIILDYGILQSYNKDEYLKSIIVHHEKKTTKDRVELILKEYKNYIDSDLLRYERDNMTIYYV